MNNSLILYSHSMPPVSSFEAYKTYIKSIPNLSEEEESNLLIEFKNSNCIASAQKLILSQLKSVLYIAEKYRGYGLPQEDLVQEGNIGLMKAVKNFDPIHKVRLYTYALIWIKSEIQSFIIKNWKLVKIATTKNLRKLFFSFKETQKELISNGVSKHEILSSLAKKLNVSESEAKEMQTYFSSEDFYIEAEQDDENSVAYQLPYYQTPETEYEEKHDQQFYLDKIQTEIANLNDKQQKVLQYRYYSEPKLTHKEIAQILKISSERVRQIELEVLDKLKKSLNH